MSIPTLIIDDHSLFNDGLHLILKESGLFHVVGQVYDSRHAYHKCFTLMPKLILVDYNMPYFNGLEVIKQLQTLAYDKKIVIVSMYADRKELSLFEAEGVDGYISKTTPAQELVAALQKIMIGKKVFSTNPPKKPPIEKDEFVQKHKLTKRELEILKLVKKDFTTEQIANELHLSFYTVETHRKNIHQKLNFNTKKELYEFLQNLQ